MVLPLTILLTSIMIFGNFAENYEFAAMKSSGISLQRAMKSLSIFIVLLSIVAFFFANNAIPWSEFKFRNLRRNIAQENPAMAIAEGQFNEIDEKTNIKVDRKYGEEERMLENVTMHLLRGTKNAVVIKAKKGQLTSSRESNILQLVLFDGNYYEDIQSRDTKSKNKKPHAKSHFEKYTMNIDLSKLNDVDYKKESITNNYLMLTSSQLKVAIDSLSTDYNDERKGIRDRAYTRLNINDVKAKANRDEARTLPNKKKDSIPYKGELIDIFKNKRKDDVLRLALSSVNSSIGIIKAKESTFKHKLKYINKHEMSLHKKFVLAFACIILFFVGAPLGAIIRKGGFGLPIVFAIVIFIAYHFIGIFAENSAEDGTIHPAIASWLSTAIMLPFGIILTRNATRDRGAFNTDIFRIVGLKIVQFFTRKKQGQDVSSLKEINAKNIELHATQTQTLEPVLLENYILCEQIDPNELEKMVVAVKEQLDNSIRYSYEIHISKIKSETSSFVVWASINNFKDFSELFDLLSQKTERVIGYWNDASVEFKGQVLEIKRVYDNIVAISDFDQAYKIGDHYQLKESENREQLIFEQKEYFLSDCFHIKEINSEVKQTTYQETDSLISSKLGMGIICVLILINITAISLGETQQLIYKLLFVLDTLAAIYMCYSAFKKSKN